MFAEYVGFDVFVTPPKGVPVADSSTKCERWDVLRTKSSFAEKHTGSYDVSRERSWI